jgi:single-stranded DNA-binding protein
MNKVIIAGTIQKIEDKDNLVRISIPTNRFGDKEETDWHNITFFGKTADIIKKHSFKGQKVVVVAKLQYNVTESKTYTNLIGNRIEFLTWQEKQNNNTDVPF